MKESWGTPAMPHPDFSDGSCVVKHDGPMPDQRILPQSMSTAENSDVANCESGNTNPPIESINLLDIRGLIPEVLEVLMPEVNAMLQNGVSGEEIKEKWPIMQVDALKSYIMAAFLKKEAGTTLDAPRPTTEKPADSPVMDQKEENVRTDNPVLGFSKRRGRRGGREDRNHLIVNRDQEPVRMENSK
jgi:hypothetical protein